MTTFPPKTCWLFCTIIDNFGDIGVSWRLAQQLHTELGYTVHLWLDDLAALRAIVPDAPNALPCTHQHIHLHHWQAGSHADDVQAAFTPDLIIETFACDLPDSVLRVIETHRPVWLNWEYLSAEDWAIRTHAMPSLQANGSAKYFWQMGFVPQSGGLLRESDYKQQQAKWFAPTQSPQKSSLNFFVFGYQSPVWTKWCKTLSAQPQKITLHIAGKPVFQSLYQSGYTSQAEPHEHRAGSLHLLPQDFVPQAQFDTLLWAADALIIRGEDSFVRAQLSGKPFLWHIYPQDEMAHLDKLDAFWTPVWHNQHEKVQAAFAALSGELNGAHNLSDTHRAECFATLLQHFDVWQQVAQQWQQNLFAQSSAMTRLQDWLVQHKQ